MNKKIIFLFLINFSSPLNLVFIFRSMYTIVFREKVKYADSWFSFDLVLKRLSVQQTASLRIAVTDFNGLDCIEVKDKYFG